MRQIILNNPEDDSKDDIFRLFLQRGKLRWLRLVYPFDDSVTELPDDKALDWQTDCAIELYNLDGNEGLKSYSENGLRESYTKAGLSEDLVNELPPPHGGVPS